MQILSFGQLLFGFKNSKFFKPVMFTIILAIVGGGFLYWKGLINKIDTLSSMNAKQDILLLQKDANIQILSKEIDLQNDAIQRSHDNYNRLNTIATAKLQELQDALTKQDIELRRKLDDIISTPTPQTCEESINLLRDTVRGLTWSN